MKSIDMHLSDETIQSATWLAKLLAREFSNGSAYPVFQGDNFARFIVEYSWVVDGVRVSTYDLAYQIRANALSILWKNRIFWWIHRPILIESGNIPRHRDDDRVIGWHGNSIKKVNDAVTVLVPLLGFDTGWQILHSEWSTPLVLEGNGKKLIIHDQTRDHWLETNDSQNGKQKLWWSGLLKRNIAQKKWFI